MSNSAEASGSNSTAVQRRCFKFLFVGDAECGKTRIIQTYFRSLAPRLITSHSAGTTYEYDLIGPNSDMTIIILDIRGACDVNNMPIFFSSTSVAVLFYAIDDPSSLENLQNIWIPRVKTFSGSHLPFMILVGNKKDLRAPTGSTASESGVSFLQGMVTKNLCRLDMFLECSAVDYECVDNVFNAAHSYVL